MRTPQSLRVAAWGQYLHWAHLNLERFASLRDDSPVPVSTAVAAHWLASEYVVLEGWRGLGISGAPVSKLLELYPEHCEALRRCRNAVYHFQDELLDPRIVKCLKNDDEELTWAIALHEEFQRFLAAYPYLHTGTFEERSELADELEACIGWFPHNTLTGSQYRLLRDCLKLENLVHNDSTSEGDVSRELAKRTARDAVALRFDSHLTALKRWSAENNGA